MSKILIGFGNDDYKVEADFYKDGDEWCVGIGENLQEGIFGFGKKLSKAITEFKSNFRNS